MNKPIRCIAACRVSTDEQAQYGTSIESQQSAVTAYIARIGGIVVGECIESGVSGALFETRAKLQKALAMLDSDEADAIVWYDISRMSRDIEFSTAIIKRIERAGKQALFCTATYASGADGFISRGVAGVLSHGERLKIRERTMRGSRARAESGIMPVRAMWPYGYRFITEADIVAGTHAKEELGKYRIEESEAHWIRQIFSEYSGGSSLSELAVMLSTHSVPSQRAGGAWALSTLRGILKNPIYKGQAAYGKYQQLTDESRLASGYGATYRLARDPGEWVTFEAPAIVTAELWQQCQEKLSTNRQRRAGRKEAHRLLSGLVRCHVCGHSKPFVAARYRYQRKGTHPVKARYRAIGHYCCGRGHKLSRCSHTKGDDASKLHSAVIMMVRSMMTDERLLGAAVKQFVKEQAQTKQKTTESTRLQNELKRLETRRAAIIEAELNALSDGRDTTPYRARLSEIDTSLTQVQQRLAAQRESKERLVAVSQSIEPWRQTAAHIVEVLESDDMSEPDKNRLLHNLIQYVVSNNNATEVSIYFNEHVAGFCYHARLEQGRLRVWLVSVNET